MQWKKIKEKRNNNEFRRIHNKKAKPMSLLPWSLGMTPYRKWISMLPLRKMIPKIRFCMCRPILKTLRWMKILLIYLHSPSILKRENLILSKMSLYLFRERRMIILIKCSKMFPFQIFQICEEIFKYYLNNNFVEVFQKLLLWNLRNKHNELLY